MTGADSLMRAAAGAFQRGFDAVLEIAPDGLPAFFIDGRGERCAILAAPPPAASPAAMWRASPDTLARIFEGGRALEGAYLSGRLKISGDMSVMARLILESST